ncbi:MAG TPA: MBL fold metallo-hydrolase [Anaerolineales bacterium]|nr:MBL fold metallo-hydrolase [Anaerolineales bacterium]
MDAIAKNVYIEENYPGVTLGVIVQPRGLIQIDAPPAPEDGRAFRASLMGLGNGHERVLINLDSHPDRTLGVRSMDCTIIAHEQTVRAFQNRPNTFKAQGDETGANWEAIPGLGSVRWAPPEISFGSQMSLHWSDTPVILESHPGPTEGAIWVILPEEKVVFIGDAVVKGEPPFLAHADIPAWLETLEYLRGGDFKGYTVISGRSGSVSPHAIRAQIELLKKIHVRIEKLGKKKSVAANVTDKLSDSILNGFKFPAYKKQQYSQRLRFGLHNYYVRHYLPASRQAVDE